MADSTAPVRRTTQQPSAVFNPYGWTKTRIRWAKLDYRWNSESRWQRLDESYVYRNMDDMIEPWNVEQMEISGEGITVNQFGAPYSRRNNSRKTTVDETKYCWQVKFEYAKCNGIVISERERRNPGEKSDKLPSFVQIQFECVALPTGLDMTVHKSAAISDDGEAGEVDEGGAKEGEVEEGEVVEEAEAEEGEEEEEEEEEEKLNPEEFPLAQLFKDRIEVKGLEIRLTFKRAGASPKNAYRFIWPAVIHFLSGRKESWNVTSKKEETENLFRSIKLDQWLMQYNKERPSAFLRESKNPEGGFFWTLRPKPIPTQREKMLAAQPASQLRRLVVPLLQYEQHATSAVPAPVPQFGAPLPSGRPEASSNKREVEDDIEARKQELYRQKVEQGKVERAARNNLKVAQDNLKAAQEKWEEEDQKLREVSEAFDEFVISGSMNKRRRLE